MLVKHIRTGELYKVLFKSFSVERQKVSVVYCQIKTGHIFDRDLEKFDRNFNTIDVEPQRGIIPRDKNQTELQLKSKSQKEN